MLNPLKICLFLIATAVCTFDSHSQSNWTLKKDKNGIKVYTKDHETKNIKYYRLITEFKGNYDKVVDLNLDFDNYESWVRDCEESEVLQTEGSTTIIYRAKYDTPWPVSDRDFVSEVRIQRTENITSITTLPSDFDYPMESGVVRITDYQDNWKVSEMDGGMVKLELEGYYSPGGSIPPWLVNLFIVDAPYESMLRLRELAK